ncbi:MAG: YceI family protein [Actinobacteria bacterium]|nr:YceI family protein [Actinomycetota bacterium]
MTSTESLTIAPAGTWQLDPVHSAVGFEVTYLGGTFKGQFREVAAQLAAEGDAAKLTGSAQVTSVDVKDENLAAHLQSPEFFDAERYPELRFTADELRLDGSTIAADGELTIKGVTKPVQITGTAATPITDGYGKERLGLQVSTAVDRTEFGLTWNTPLPTGEQALANDVKILGELFFVKAA